MAKFVASTSVQDLIQQWLSPEEIREKAIAYRAAGKVLWGWLSTASYTFTLRGAAHLEATSHLLLPSARSRSTLHA